MRTLYLITAILIANLTFSQHPFIEQLAKGDTLNPLKDPRTFLCKADLHIKLIATKSNQDLYANVYPETFFHFNKITKKGTKLDNIQILPNESPWAYKITLKKEKWREGYFSSVYYISRSGNVIAHVSSFNDSEVGVWSFYFDEIWGHRNDPNNYMKELTIYDPYSSAL